MNERDHHSDAQHRAAAARTPRPRCVVDMAYEPLEFEQVVEMNDMVVVFLYEVDL